MILKKLSGASFIISFLMAIVLFTGNGSQYISYPNAKIIFLISGALALMLNLISFKFGKGSHLFNFFYWIGSVLLFIGFTFRIMHYPYSTPILIFGVTIFSVSFIIPTNNKSENSNSDILDDLD